MAFGKGKKKRKTESSKRAIQINVSWKDLKKKSNRESEKPIPVFPTLYDHDDEKQPLIERNSKSGYGAITIPVNEVTEFRMRRSKRKGCHWEYDSDPAIPYILVGLGLTIMFSTTPRAVVKAIGQKMQISMTAQEDFGNYAHTNDSLIPLYPNSSTAVIRCFYSYVPQEVSCTDTGIDICCKNYEKFSSNREIVGGKFAWFKFPWEKSVGENIALISLPLLAVGVPMLIGGLKDFKENRRGYSKDKVAFNQAKAYWGNQLVDPRSRIEKWFFKIRKNHKPIIIEVKRDSKSDSHSEPDFEIVPRYWAKYLCWAGMFLAPPATAIWVEYSRQNIGLGSIFRNPVWKTKLDGLANCVIVNLLGTNTNNIVSYHDDMFTYKVEKDENPFIIHGDLDLKELGGEIQAGEGSLTKEVHDFVNNDILEPIIEKDLAGTFFGGTALDVLVWASVNVFFNACWIAVCSWGKKLTKKMQNGFWHALKPRTKVQDIILDVANPNKKKPKIIKKRKPQELKVNYKNANSLLKEIFKQDEKGEIYKKQKQQKEVIIKIDEKKKPKDETGSKDSTSKHHFKK